MKTEIFVNLFRLNKKIITLKQHYIDAMSEKKNCFGGSFFVHKNTEQEAKTNAKFIQKGHAYTADGSHLQGSAVHSGYHSHLPDCRKWHL